MDPELIDFDTCSAGLGFLKPVTDVLKELK